MHFIERDILILEYDVVEICSSGPIDYKWALGLMMAWHTEFIPGNIFFPPKYSHFTHHSGAHLWQWVMGYLLWFQCVVYVLYFPLWCCVQYVDDLGWVKSDITASSLYLNKCWLIIEGVLWHLHESIIARSGQDIDPSMILKIILLRLP